MDRRSRALLLAVLVALAGCGAPAATPTTTQSSPGAPTTPQSSASPSQSPIEAIDGETYEVTVTEVVDGDTMHVRYRNGSTDTIRLLGVDTPEVHTRTSPEEFEGIPDSEAGREWLRDWGRRASEFARTEIAGQRVRIIVDAEADRRGGYGRLLVYVAVDGELLNLQLLRRGYARMYDSSFSQRDRFREAEREAQATGVGLWGFGETTATPVADGSDGSDLAVVQIHADAEGNDHENRNDEYVVFENTGERTRDLSGWTVRDEAGHTYRVPDGVTLAPGERVTLYTGDGADTDAALYWGSDRAVWNNAGDTIIVENENGTVVLEKSY